MICGCLWKVANCNQLCETCTPNRHTQYKPNYNKLPKILLSIAIFLLQISYLYLNSESIFLYEPHLISKCWWFQISLNLISHFKCWTKFHIIIAERIRFRPASRPQRDCWKEFIYLFIYYNAFIGVPLYILNLSNAQSSVHKNSGLRSPNFNSPTVKWIKSIQHNI